MLEQAENYEYHYCSLAVNFISCWNIKKSSCTIEKHVLFLIDFDHIDEAVPILSVFHKSTLCLPLRMIDGG